MGANVSDEQVEEMRDWIEEEVIGYFEVCQEWFDEEGWEYSEPEETRRLHWEVAGDTGGEVTSSNGETEFTVSITVLPSDQFVGKFVGFNVSVDVNWKDGEEVLEYWPNPAGDRWARDVGVVVERLARAPRVSKEDFESS
jgi:hypothetical protein